MLEENVSAKPKCRVLVVEDEAMIAMLVEDMVLEFGSEIVGPAARVEQALSLAGSAELDAAILDINVGGAVIFPVAHVLEARGIPIIFATGYGPATVPARFQGRPVLSKPFSFRDLSGVLRAVLKDRPCHIEAAA
jgi:DNA-binding response OmpR family regulator